MSQGNDLVTSLLRPEIIALKAYQTEDASNLIKLDAMENPYTWPAGMISEWLETLRQSEPNRYPDPNAKKLKTAIRKCYELPDSLELLLGNGSDEIIQILLMAISATNTRVVAPEPTFVMYRQIAQCLGMNYEGVPLREKDFSLDLERMIECIQRYQPAVIFISYPNNPTGNLFAEEDILAILESAPGVVVLDEAYAPFAGATFLKYLGQFGNLLVMRTLSKLGLAGLRLGFLVGSPTWINQFEKLRLPYNINTLTQISAEFALSNYEILRTQTQQICEDRAYLFEKLRTMDALTPFSSSANFILFRLEHADANQVYENLKAAGILIKNIANAGGLLSNCLRVTVGKPEENNSFLTALDGILSDHG